MGDVTGSGIISSMVHNVTVGQQDLNTTLSNSQKRLTDRFHNDRSASAEGNYEDVVFWSFRYAFRHAAVGPSLILLGPCAPMISNIEISFLRLPLNPRISAVFVGLDNYIRILSDAALWHSLWMTFWYTALVVIGSTGLGLAVAVFFNREFRLRKTARSLVILSYVTPSISLVFAGNTCSTTATAS